MVIALFALAFAMIVGGLFAAILGWDIVLVERGWTMVIAGSISASGGALLLGVTAVVSKLSRIQAELMRLQANLVEDAEEEERSALPAAAGVSAAALGGGLFARTAAEDRDRSGETEEDQHALPLFEDEEVRQERGEAVAEPETERREAEEIEEAEGRSVSAAPQGPEGMREAGEAEDIPAVKIPDFLLAGRFRGSERAEARIPEPERTPYASPMEPEFHSAANDLGPAPEEPQRKQEPEEAPELDMAQGVQSEEPAAPEPAQNVSVIGSYNSGDNKYVMYSDGSIEADTPQGMFRFGSLDALKEFIATGKGGTRIT